jgi:hypothetical protein
VDVPECDAISVGYNYPNGAGGCWPCAQKRRMHQRVTSVAARLSALQAKGPGTLFPLPLLLVLFPFLADHAISGHHDFTRMERIPQSMGFHSQGIVMPRT